MTLLPKKFSRVVVDADYLIYRINATQRQLMSKSEFTIPTSEMIERLDVKKETHPLFTVSYGYPKVHEPVENALYLVKAMIRDLKKAVNKEELELYVSPLGKDNFRYRTAKTLPYKGNRVADEYGRSTGKPVYYDAARDYLINTHKARCVPHIEADDAVSIRSNQDRENTLIVHVDKDINNTPGHHYFPGMANKEPAYYYMTELESYRHLSKQLLLGDKGTDNIGGLKHWCKPRMLGPKKVDSLLDCATTEEEMDQIVKDSYLQYVLDDPDGEKFKERLKEIHSLVYMLQTKEEYQKIKEFMSG